MKLVEMLLTRGARVNATNMGDDIPLHLAAAHGHLEVVQTVSKMVDGSGGGAADRASERADRRDSEEDDDFDRRHIGKTFLNCEKSIFALQLIRHRSDVNALNEHGNSPLHYACFWGYADIARELINHGGLVSFANKDGDTPLDKAKPALAQE